MGSGRTPVWIRYLAALGLVVVSVVVRGLLTPIMGDELPYVVFFGAVAISAWQGGFGPGLFATGLCAMAAAYFWSPPIASLAVHEPSKQANLVVFVIIGLFISLLHERLRGQVGDRKRAESQLQEYARHLQVLNRRLIESQESERRRLSRELHDEIGQTLTAIKVDIHAARRLPPNESEARLDEAVSMVDSALERVRSLSLDLRPSLLDDLGLAPALRWYVDRLSQRAGFTISMTASDFQRRLPAELETTCFRVVQEAVTNVIRHAKASHVDIELQIEEDEVLLTVRDDGAGFDVIAARGQGQRNFNLGLVGMQERVELLGGQLSILSQFGEGTELTARFDLSSSVLTQKDVAKT